MLRKMCKSKIHNAVVTEATVKYGGSIKIDSSLMKKADLLANEMVLVVNLRNAARFETYVIPAPAGSGTIGLQGGAALLGRKGDRLIIMSGCFLNDREARNHKPKYIYLGKGNRAI